MFPYLADFDVKDKLGKWCNECAFYIPVKLPSTKHLRSPEVTAVKGLHHGGGIEIFARREDGFYN